MKKSTNLYYKMYLQNKINKLHLSNFTTLKKKIPFNLYNKIILSDIIKNILKNKVFIMLIFFSMKLQFIEQILKILLKFCKWNGMVIHNTSFIEEAKVILL